MRGGRPYLLVAQGDDGIDAGGAPGRKGGCHQHRQQQGAERQRQAPGSARVQALIQPASSMRWRLGYSEPSSTRRASDRLWMCEVMA
jgi:hypothetical protein